MRMHFKLEINNRSINIFRFDSHIHKIVEFIFVFFKLILLSDFGIFMKHKKKSH